MTGRRKHYMSLDEALRERDGLIKNLIETLIWARAWKRAAKSLRSDFIALGKAHRELKTSQCKTCDNWISGPGNGIGYDWCSQHRADRNAEQYCSEWRARGDDVLSWLAEARVTHG